MKQYLKDNNVKQITSAPYHPQSNGAAENLVKKFKISFYRSLEEGRTEKEAIRIFLKSYRNSPSSRTGKSPVELMFNKKIKLINGEMRNIKLTKGNTLPLKENSRSVKKTKDFLCNDPVWERTKNKLQWTKARIKERVGINMYKLISDDENKVHVRHANQLRKRKIESPTVLRRSSRIGKMPRVDYKLLSRGGK